MQIRNGYSDVTAKKANCLDLAGRQAPEVLLRTDIINNRTLIMARIFSMPQLLSAFTQMFSA